MVPLDRRRCPAFVFLVAVVLLLFWPVEKSSLAQVKQDPGPAEAPKTIRLQTNPAEAKRHFETGVRLFRDHNYGGALVEFDASYQLNPTAVALQNLAVCQKALFRYAAAIETLERMLRDFPSELSPEDRAAAEGAVREMSALLGTLVITTVPVDARVMLNDRVLTREARSAPIRVATGEYTVNVDAPGYMSSEQIVAIASQKETRVEVRLEPETGMLAVHVSESQAEIAIDGVQVGYEDWKGRLPAGPHEIAAFTAKLHHRETVMVHAGLRSDVDIKLTSKDGLPPAYDPGIPAYVPPPLLRGWFGYLLGTVDASFVPSVPLSDGTMFHTKTGPSTAGVFAGLAVGSRLWRLGSAEFVFDGGSRTLRGCVGENPCTDAASNLIALRFAAGGRLFTRGTTARLFATGRLGAAWHELQLPHPFPTRQSLGVYGQLGGGVEIGFGRFLADAALAFSAEGTQGLGTTNQPVTSGGLEFRFGYGNW